MPPLPIEGVLKHYAWGSERELADFLGRKPSGRPEAELWFGAHEGGPSRILGSGPLESAQNLLELYRADPEEAVGEGAVARFGGRFPFLFKVLAAAEPLSLQAHPSIEQARLGYREERARGLAPESDQANYKDENHKPELLLALRPFAVLSGFCSWEESQRRFTLFSLSGPLSPITGPLRAFAEARQTGSEAAAREAFLRALFALPESERQMLTRLFAEMARDFDSEADRALGALLVRLAQKYPGDPGLAVVLLMNHLELSPGQALFMPARKLHAYLDGLGLEVMASSDNVLRGGLTSKRVDVAELCRVLDFEADIPEVLGGTELSVSASIQVRAYRAPVSEFLLSMITIQGKEAHSIRGPALVLVLDGTLRGVSGMAMNSLTQGQGEACFIPAADGPVTLTGSARFAVVSLPEEVLER